MEKGDKIVCHNSKRRYGKNEHEKEPGGKRATKESEELVSELYRQIGQQKVELDWLKKKV